MIQMQRSITCFSGETLGLSGVELGSSVESIFADINFSVFSKSVDFLILARSRSQFIGGFVI